MIGGFKPEKPMRTKEKGMALGEFLRTRGVILEEVEAAHAAKTGAGSHDSYDNARAPQQCLGFITMVKRAVDDPGSDRCRQKTKHPSGLCPQHRRMVR